MRNGLDRGPVSLVGAAALVGIYPLTIRGDGVRDRSETRLCLTHFARLTKRVERTDGNKRVETNGPEHRDLALLPGIAFL